MTSERTTSSLMNPSLLLNPRSNSTNCRSFPPEVNVSVICSTLIAGLDEFSIPSPDRCVRSPSVHLPLARRAPLRSAPPIGAPVIETRELDLQDCGLGGDEPAVEPDLGVAVVGSSAVLTRAFAPLGDRGTVRGDRSAVAIGPEVLRRIKRE